VPQTLRPARSTVAFLLVSALVMGSCRAAVQAPSIAAEHVVSGTLQGRTGAYLTVPYAASRVRIVTARLPGMLYRISTSAGSGLVPVVTGRDGRIRVALRPTGEDGPDEVRIVLNRAVRWDIRLPAGAGEQQLDLARGRVTRLDLGASGLIEMRLPRPSGTVPVTFLAGVGTAAITVSPGTRVRFDLAEPAGSATTPWAPGILQSPGWPTARDRYAVHARSVVGSLILRQSGPEAR
jgi:hypothetical protein